MKIVMIIALILVSGLIQAEESSWLSVEWAFQLGWIPQGNIAFYSPEYPIPGRELKNNFDCVIKTDFILFDFLFVGGIFTSYMSYNNEKKEISFLPTGIMFDFESGIIISDTTRIVFNHRCTHPVVANFQIHGGYPAIDSSFDRVYLEFKSKIDL